ncbi:MAG TPA: S9 family peptidase [Streptosporangiaceae bacterium]|nr:S9 family peptidase [Streptosporangiaceae bacterium]
MAWADEVELIPRRVLFGNPDDAKPRLSPDGTRLAWIAPYRGVLNVWVSSVTVADGLERSAARVVTEDTDRGVRTFGWAHDGRRLLYVQDTGGDENWHLHDVDLETMQRRDLTPFDGVRAMIVAADRKFPTEILIGLNRDNPKLHDVYRVDLVTGELTLEVKNPGLVGWVADQQLVVRAAVKPRPDGGRVLLVRDAADAPWRPLLTVPGDDAAGSRLIAFSEDGASVLAVSSVGAETSRLVRLDVATGAAEVLAADPEADVGRVRLRRRDREPQIVVFQRERSDYLVVDPSVAGDLTAIRALHPGDPVFAGSDDPDSIWLVAFTNDSGPVPYFIYDRASRAGRLLFTNRPELSRYQLAPMEPFSFAARDGLEIHGYLTFPPGADRAGLPAVLLVHGGPWARYSWGFSQPAQWLANRGYVCIQVNYRGSTGYGKAFVNAADREWGGKMHEDLVDAVAYVTGRGWADSARIAIFGGSYGGYAALVGAAFTPGVFCCAVDMCGPSNLKTLIETVPPYWAPEIARFHRRVGDPDKDAEFLWSRSPLSRVGDIRIPLLIAQGANDPRVKQAESEQIVAALERAGVEHEYLLFPDEGHGFAKPENQLRFFAAAERFLARHLGGRAEEDVPDPGPGSANPVG